jgi:hypothetical protein
MFKERERSIGWDFQKGFYNKQIFAKMSMGVSTGGLEAPTLAI